MAIVELGKTAFGLRQVFAAAAVLLVTAVFLPFRDSVNQTEVALTLLLAVLFSSTLFGSTSGLVASVVGILSFNFFFLPPYHTFNISGHENWIAFGVFVVTAFITGQLSGSAKRRAEESEARQAEIERLYTELQSAFEQASQAEALRQSERLKSSLLDAVTHDLRTPLTSIKASVSTLRADSGKDLLDDETRSEFLEVIEEETDRLNNFIEEMVAIAKIEAEASKPDRRSASVDEIVSNAVERANRRIKGRKLEIDVDPNLPNIYADAASISEVVFTLLENAAKYSSPGSRIALDARPGAESTVVIGVQDQGRGIAPELRERVFDKFFRVEAQDVHVTGSGLGLGLAIARGILESQGGSIRVADADEGFKTKFVITLPVLEEAIETRAETNVISTHDHAEKNLSDR